VKTTETSLSDKEANHVILNFLALFSCIHRADCEALMS
jgi:hypothetical protein